MAKAISIGDIRRLSRDPSYRRALSRALAQKAPIEVDISGPRAQYVRFRVADPRWFDRRGFRTIQLGGRGTLAVIGCRVGGWDPVRKVCRTGTRVQSILIPKQRVADVTARWITRKIAANPIRQNPTLMTVFNPGPAGSFPVGKAVPFDQAARWIEANLPPSDVREFRKAVKNARKFHLGAAPRTITRVMVPVSNRRDVTERVFTYSMGKSDREFYTPDRHSRKSGAIYVHQWRDKPHALAVGNRLILKPLKGRARISDWLRG